MNRTRVVSVPVNPVLVAFAQSLEPDAPVLSKVLRDSVQRNPAAFKNWSPERWLGGVDDQTAALRAWDDLLLREMFAEGADDEVIMLTTPKHKPHERVGFRRRSLRRHAAAIG